MLDKNLKTALDVVSQRFLSLDAQLQNPQVIADHKLYLEIQKEHSKLKKIHETYSEYQKLNNLLMEAQEFINSSDDMDLVSLLRDEFTANLKVLSQMEYRLRVLLIPKDEDDEKNVIVEIRGAAGGEEANLFAQDLFKIYQKWAHNNKWDFRLLDVSHSESGGFSQVVFSVAGKGVVYGKIKHEAGVHRVQRVPITESVGRVHTSTVTVTVIPEQPPESEVTINPDDLRIDTYRSSGAGGQSVNTTDSAVRVTHIPSGIVVNCQQERSQIANKDLAIRILKSKLAAAQKAEAEKLESNFRKRGGLGFRAEKIRTYNWSQDRVTDHRIAMSLSLRSVLEGKLQPFTEALLLSEETLKVTEAAHFGYKL